LFIIKYIKTLYPKVFEVANFKLKLKKHYKFQKVQNGEPKSSDLVLN